MKLEIRHAESGGLANVAVFAVGDRSLKRLPEEIFLSQEQPVVYAQVNPGSYLVEARWANGAVSTRNVDPDNPVADFSTLRTSPHEWLADISNLRALPLQSQESLFQVPRIEVEQEPAPPPLINATLQARLGDVTVVASGEVSSVTLAAPEAMATGDRALAARLRFYGRHGKALRPIPPSGTRLILHPPLDARQEVLSDYLRLDIPPHFVERLPKGLRLEIAKPGQPSRVVHLLAFAHPTTVVLALNAGGVSAPVGTVTVHDTRVQNLLDLLSGMPGSSAQAILSASEGALSAAEDALRGKMRDPAAAMAGAYVLLKYGAWERMHDWTAQLMTVAPDAPDAAVLDGWRHLSSKQVMSRDPQAARQAAQAALAAFLEARRRGAPIFAEGVRRLHDGLSLLVRAREPSETRRKPGRYVLSATERGKARRARTWLTPYVTCLAPIGALAGFLGQGPDSPGRLEVADNTWSSWATSSTPTPA